MAELLQVETPDFASIEQETGPKTLEALQRTWFAANETFRRLGARIGVAKDRFEPLLRVETATTNQNDLDTKGATVIQFTGASAINVTGFGAPETNKARLLILLVTGAGTITLKHESASSAAANRIHASAGADIAMATDGKAGFVYASAKWRQIF